jgi:hypothetical protein
MTRTENDLRAALHELGQRADQQDAPSTVSVPTARMDDRLGRSLSSAPRRFPRWLPPLAAAAVVVASAATAVMLDTQHSGSSHPSASQAGGQPPGGRTAAPRSTTVSQKHTATSNGTTPATVLEDAAATLESAPTWSTPAAHDFYYVRTTQATTWTSVSGRQAGQGRTSDGTKIWVPGCAHGRIVSIGESGPCTLNDVPHYLGDAPTTPSAWDAYLEQIAPGAKAAGAQGKIIVAVLHQDLIAPKATAALLRYTASCPGLHTLTVRPVAGENLIGVTCTSMTNGAYGLAFNAAAHHFVGFVGVSGSGRQNNPAEIIRKTGIVPTVGRTP